MLASRSIFRPRIPIDESGMVCRLTFDKFGQVIEDLSGNGLAGTLSATRPTFSAAGPAPGVNALTFNGVSSFLALNGSGFQGAQAQFSVSVWINPTTLAGMICANDHTDATNNGFRIFISASNFIFSVGNGTTNALDSPTPGPIAGQWAHYVCTLSPSTLTVYGNGVNLGTAPLSGGMSAASNKLAFGYNPNYSGDFFSGSVADVRIYTRAISQAEAYNLYASTLAGWQEEEWPALQASAGPPPTSPPLRSLMGVGQ